MEIQRPHIAQHTDVGPHVEKAAVVSQAFHLDLVKIPVGSYSGGVDVSWELANRSAARGAGPDLQGPGRGLRTQVR